MKLNVPDSAMEYAGDYYYVFIFVDDHADLYRDHKSKRTPWY